LIGIGFAAGAKQGVILTIALTLEIFSLGIAVSSELGRIKYSRSRTILIVICLSFSILIGAIIGAFLLNILTEKILVVILSFGLAALLYLITEELLVEAHEEPDNPLITATFFVGFLIFLLVGVI
jgi:ZIP family zinc transporter